MDEQKECCGKCKWHLPNDTFPSDWICTNAESDLCSDWTEYNESCEWFEERE